MKKLKFRAWDKDKRIMLSWEQIIHNTEMNLFGGLFELFRREEIRAMQFTGLLDKHGEDIYEGDIVKRGVEMPEDYFAKFVIKYDGVLAQFRMFEINYNAKNNILATGEDIPYSCGAEKSQRKREIEIGILGNIHQNKDLIE